MSDDPKRYDWADEGYVCADCRKRLYVTKFVIERGFDIVGGGYDLGGVIVALHTASEHVAFTADDLVAHGVPVPW